MSAARDRFLHSIAVVLTDQPRLPMEQLAHAIGLSRATLHRMYPTREAIVAAVQQAALACGWEALDSAEIERGPVDEALRRLIAAYIPNSALFLFLWRGRGEPGQSASDRDADWEPQRERVLALFRRGQEEGSLRVDLSAQWMVDAMGALLSANAESIRAGRLASADAVDSVVGMLLDGARRRPAG